MVGAENYDPQASQLPNDDPLLSLPSKVILVEGEYLFEFVGVQN
jgi:hypothetical protein